MTARTAALAVTIFLLGASLLAFASVEEWSAAWLLCGATVAFLLAHWSVEPSRLLSGAAGSVAVPALLLVAWGLFQTVPLPRPVVAALSPATSRIQTAVLPPGGGAAMPEFLLQQARERGARVQEDASLPPGPADPGSLVARSGLSVNPHTTRRAALAWLTPILLFLAASRVAKVPRHRYLLLWGIVAWAGVLGAIALAQRLTWNGRILWLRQAPDNATPLGPFVNPNNFAGWMEMGLLIALGLAFAILSGPTRQLSRRSARAAILDRSWALPRLLLLGGEIVLGGCGMLLSGSRGGAIALLVGAMVLLPLRRVRLLLPLAVVLVLLVAFAVGLAAWLGKEDRSLQTAFFAEGSRDPSLSMRSDIWGRTWRIVGDYPLTGTGLGTFRWAYGAYDREGEWQNTDQAHNDYLQLASETGIPGVLLLAWLAAAVVRRVLRPALLRGEGLPPWTNAGLAAAVFAMLLHSVLEFNLQIPAVAVLFAVAGGALAAAAEDPDGGSSGEASRSGTEAAA